MLRKGIVERQIEMLALTLATFLGLKKGGQAKEARENLRNACANLIGLDWNLALVLTPDSLLSLLQSEDKLDSGRCATLAVLLHEQGLLDEEMGLTPVAQARYRKAARLLSEALTQEKRLWTPEFAARLRELTAKTGAANPLADGKDETPITPSR